MNRAEQEARDLEELMGAKKYWVATPNLGPGELPSHTHGVCGNNRLGGNEERIMIRKIEPREFFVSNPHLGQYDIVIDEAPINGLRHDFIVMDEKVDVKCSILKAYHDKEQRLLNAMYSEMLKAFGAPPRKNRLLLLCGR